MSQERIENNPNSAMMREVGRLNAERKGELTESDEELPQGSSQVEESEETPVVEAGAAEETSEEAEGVAAQSESEPIRIGDQIFTSEKEAFAYAAKLEQDRLLAEAHSAGIREALEATRAAQAPAQTEEPEDDFEQRFYANPKEALKAVQAQARDEAVNLIRQEQQREKLWADFLTENPDIRRKDAERVLNENWETIGRLTDYDKAKKILAQRVRAEYEEIASYAKPRTTLASKPQAVSPSGGAPRGVTPKGKEEKVLSFSEQLRQAKGVK